MSAQQGRSPVTVAVIDDHEAIHEAVKVWCAQADAPIKVAGGYFSAEEFLAEQPPGAGHNVVIFDLELQSRRTDFEGLERIIAAGYRVVVYSHLSADEIILRCLDLGAVTYLVKSEGKRHLIDAVEAAWTDEPYVGPQMAGAIVNDVNFGRPKLAARERQVLIAWFQTESKDLVAQKLHIAPTTVRTHLQRIRAKYAAVGRPAPTKSALVARAIQDAIIVVDDL
jgi:DNA-binding NarL/FixJ family response regulator